MSRNLWLDFETYNELSLKAVGTDVYARSAEILIATWAVDAGPVQRWDATLHPEVPAALMRLLADPEVLVTAHNAMFDRLILKYNRQGLPYPAQERWRCTMVQALSHALPPSLDELGRVLGLPQSQAKLADGRKLIGRFCQPAPKNHKARRYDRLSHPEEWEHFCLYGEQDITAMRECARRMPTLNWSARDIALYHLDQRINDRGFQVDRQLVDAAIASTATEKAWIGARFRELTRGLVDRPSLRAQFLAYLQLERGLNIEDTRSETLRTLIKSGRLDAEVEELFELAIASNKTSTSKYARLAPAISPDGRFRCGLQFAGAGRTRRFAGRVFQPQNLPSRGLPKAHLVEAFIDAMKLGIHDVLFEDLMLYGAASLRGAVVTSEGKHMPVADLSNIEGRMLAWLAGEEWKLQAFRDFDAGTGPDLYNVTANMITGIDPWKVTKNDRNIFGKVPDLSCIAEGQLVSTDAGLVPIENVTLNMRVWDGTAFVAHAGVIFRGIKDVYEHDGLIATLDHEVFIERDGGESCMPFGEAIRSHSPLAKPHPHRCEGALHKPETHCVSELRSEGGDIRIRNSHRCGSVCGQELGPSPDEPASAGPDRQHERLCPWEFTVGDPHREQPEQAFQHSGYVLGGGRERVALLRESGSAADATRHDPRGDLRRRKACCLGEAKELAGYRGKARVFDILDAGPRHRFVVSGCLVHNCGYGGGVAGFQQFCKVYGVRMAEHWGTIQASIDPEFVSRAQRNISKGWAQQQIADLEISDGEWIACETVKLAWRAKHPAIVSFWHNVEAGIRQAIQYPGTSHKAARVTIGVRTIGGHQYLLIKLPSGRYLTYFHPEITEDGSIAYWGMASDEGSTVRAWVKCYTHGGKAVGNITQSSALDLFLDAMPRVEDAGMPIILSVHDELLTETTTDRDHLELAGLLATNPPWAPGLPLAAAGFTTTRYRKE